jgi:RHS repeat-associated protein
VPPAVLRPAAWPGRARVSGPGWLARRAPAGRRFPPGAPALRPGTPEPAYTGAAAGAGGPDTVTASYLLAVNREARTLLDATGTSPGTSQTTGPGTGYYLTDAHGSVTAMIDDSGQVTASYAYGDYGQPIGASPALLPTPAASPAGNAAVNPFGYDGAYTNPATGTQYLPARTYDPAQGRFLSLDAADQINRYQAFDTNPVNNTDPTGQWAFPQILTDVFAAALFIACGIVSVGAAAPVLAAVVAGEEAAATAITASVAFNAVSAVTNLAAGATSATLAVNDAAELDGYGFLSDTAKEDLTTATTVIGSVATAAGVGAGAADLLGDADEAAAGGSTATADQPATTTAASAAAPPADDEVDIFGGNQDLEDYFNYTYDNPGDPYLSSTQYAFEGASASEDLDLGQIAEVPDTAGSPLKAPPVTPQSPGPAAPQLADVQQTAGQNANLNPVLQPFGQADAVPDGVAVTNSALVATGTSPPAASNGLEGLSPLTQSATTGIQDVVNSNSAGAAPQQPPSLLNENLSPPTIGISEPGLLLNGTGLG